MRESLYLETYTVSKTRWAFALSGLILSLISLLVTIWAYNDVIEDSNNTSRGVVIDAGSSHTSFNLYRWELASSAEKIELIYQCVEDFGLDQFADSPEMIEQHFQPCLQSLEAKLSNVSGNCSLTKRSLSLTSLS